MREGDVIAIFMENQPAVVFYWLGLAKIGAVGALINYNLRDRPLSHCLEAANAMGIVFGAEMAEGEKYRIQPYKLTTISSPGTEVIKNHAQLNLAWN